MIRELIRKELAEASVTGNIDGGEGPPKTPYAFRDPKDDDKDEDDLKLSAGMSVVKENYWHYRNDESLSTKQKLAKSMTEIRNRITEIERLVKYNVKLKNEMRFESAQYMKRTKTALGKISEKLVRLSLKVKDLV
jgi:hypothetical protein|tara:strand:- start:953 stop:1357 length:405 start_codon:yes stop_codon:yes gene_type:complete